MAETVPQQKQPVKRSYIFAVGRRKEAVARVRLYEQDSFLWGDLEVKKGDIAVNQKPIEQYFLTAVAKDLYIKPFQITNTLGKFIVLIRVAGGGKSGQLEACVHGIARALNTFNKEKFRSNLKKHGLLTRDARVRLRRNVGTGGKARRRKQSPKR